MSKALLLVDLQNDFMSGGALEVPGANEMIPFINELILKFSVVVATLDFHPTDHCSFAVNHPGKQIGEVTLVDEIPQILWPAHCVQNTKGAELIEQLDQKHITKFIYKGNDPQVDSYSAFYDNAKKKSTGLADYLKVHDVTDLYIAGVATDYCVLYTALDAINEGFKVYLIKMGCRGINSESIESAYQMIEQAGGVLD